MDENLCLLADKLGIAKSFSAIGAEQGFFKVREDVIKFFCHQYGYDAKTPEDVRLSLQKAEMHSWKKTLENIIIVPSNKLRFSLVLDKQQLNEPIKIQLFPRTIQDESFEKVQEVSFVIEQERESKLVGNKEKVKLWLKLKDKPAYGYYDMVLTCGVEKYLTILAVVPEKCYTTSDVESAKLWGYTLQLYSLKSRRNWGVGDFTDLADFVTMCAKVGADIIGLNPLNALSHDFPENASPYSSISRLFLNPIYIDVEKVPGFSNVTTAALRKEIEEIKQKELIDYTRVYNLKIEVLKKLFERGRNDKQYYQQFQLFEQSKGYDLEMLATYQAISHQQKDVVEGGWYAWDKNLQNPLSLKVDEFKKQNRESIEFFKFLQFEADRQLQNVYEKVKNLGLKIGLYRDLPVGVCKDSAELWMDRYVFIDKAGAGAPPDAFFPQGQKWGLGAFNPYELKNRAYEPYLKILRANMAYAGALRIDHVMGLMRLFMIPDDKDEGTYIYYNFEDMLNLLALESHLHKCVIVGESIGNLPEGFIEQIRARNIYSISVLWSERWNDGCGNFKLSKDYPENSFVSLGTHDMPPLKMWWFGYDIELKFSLHMMTDKEKSEAYKAREYDRYLLLSALDSSGLWPEDKKRQGDYLYGENYPEGIEEAVHKLLAKSPSKVVMLQLEDVFQVDVEQNLPGTDIDKYPNWRHRLPVDLEDFKQSDAFWRHVDVIKNGRKC